MKIKCTYIEESYLWAQRSTLEHDTIKLAPIFTKMTIKVV